MHLPMALSSILVVVDLLWPALIKAKRKCKRDINTSLRIQTVRERFRFICSGNNNDRCTRPGSGEERERLLH